MKIKIFSLLLFSLHLLFIVLISCKETTMPKPYGFHRLELPEHKYQIFSDQNCPFTFEYPVYGKLEKERIDSCFFNVRFDDFSCKWHITTRVFNDEKINYYTALEDYRELVYKHSQKGSIYETPINTKNSKGLFFELYGEVPTSADFFVSDSLNYAIVNSFYFNTAIKNDSLAPVIAFIKEDLKHMVNSIKWKE